VLAAVADRIGVLRGGELVELDGAAAVLRRPRHPYTRALVAAAPAFPRAAASGAPARTAAG
jgi:peptide/nickel transport system ATP-binding protein